MIGHCGGLRPSQKIGDYVLAHAYLRDDHVLDDVLPPEIPLPPIAEVQQALAERGRGSQRRAGRRPQAAHAHRHRGHHRRPQLGAALHPVGAAPVARAARSAIDMESATIAAQGYRFRVPYGTLLCVSDKPLHGEIKLPGQANRFYEQAIAAHLQIGIARLRAAARRRRRGCTAASCGRSTSRRSDSALRITGAGRS